MPITPGGRVSPNDGDDYDLVTDLAAMQVSNEAATAAAIAAMPQNYRIGTDAQRLALAGANLFEGLRFRTTNTDRDWFYSGTTWLSVDEGMYIIRPTTVSGTGVSIDSTTGYINLTSTPTAGASINGVFSTRFRKYLVEMDFSSASAAANIRIQMRNGGVTNSTNNYTYNLIEIGPSAGPARSYVSAANAAELCRVDLGGGSASVSFYNPAEATGTRATFESIDSGTYFRTGGMTPTGTAAGVSDGFAISTTNTSTISGRIRVYGLA